MVFCGLEEKTVRQLLSKMTQQSLQVELKAVMTAHNQKWPFGALLGELEKENSSLQTSLEEGMSDEELERLARERLALVLPGEKIFYFVTDREEHPWNLRSGQY